MSLYRSITAPAPSGRSAKCHTCLVLDWLDDNDPDSAADVQADLASTRPGAYIAESLTALAQHVGLDFRVGGGSVQTHRKQHKETL